jgi:hypothetical protein
MRLNPCVLAPLRLCVELTAFLRLLVPFLGGGVWRGVLVRVWIGRDGGAAMEKAMTLRQRRVRGSQSRCGNWPRTRRLPICPAGCLQDAVRMALLRKKWLIPRRDLSGARSGFQGNDLRLTMPTRRGFCAKMAQWRGPSEAPEPHLSPSVPPPSPHRAPTVAWL